MLSSCCFFAQTSHSEVESIETHSSSNSADENRTDQAGKLTLTAVPTSSSSSDSETPKNLIVLQLPLKLDSPNSNASPEIPPADHFLISRSRLPFTPFDSKSQPELVFGYSTFDDESKTLILPSLDTAALSKSSEESKLISQPFDLENESPIDGSPTSTCESLDALEHSRPRLSRALPSKNVSPTRGGSQNTPPMPVINAFSLDSVKVQGTPSVISLTGLKGTPKLRDLRFRRSSFFGEGFSLAQLEAVMPFIPLEVSALYTSLFYKAALVAQSLTPPFGEVDLQFLTSTLGVPLSQPRVDLVDAAILFVDMSGFTPLTERLTEKGMAGVEELSKHLNQYFGPICDRIFDHGGDVLKFAGDALLVMFSPLSRSVLMLEGVANPRIDDIEASIAELTIAQVLNLRALRCAQALHAEFNDFRPVPDITLRLHSALASGRVCSLHVALHSADAAADAMRFEYLIKGLPLPQLGDAMHLAEHGDIVMAASSFTLIRDHVHAVELEHGCARLLSLKADATALPMLSASKVAGTVAALAAAAERVLNHIALVTHAAASHASEASQSHSSQSHSSQSHSSQSHSSHSSHSSQASQAAQSSQSHSFRHHSATFSEAAVTRRSSLVAFNVDGTLPALSASARASPDSPAAKLDLLGTASHANHTQPVALIPSSRTHPVLSALRRFSPPPIGSPLASFSPMSPSSPMSPLASSPMSPLVSSPLGVVKRSGVLAALMAAEVAEATEDGAHRYSSMRGSGSGFGSGFGFGTGTGAGSGAGAGTGAGMGMHRRSLSRSASLSTAFPAALLKPDIPETPERRTLRLLVPQWLVALCGALASYLPVAVRPRIVNGHSFLNEFRRVTTLFVLLPEQVGFDVPQDTDTDTVTVPRSPQEGGTLAGALAQLQRIVSMVGDVARTHSGDVRQVITDDKGTVAIVVFGLQSSIQAPVHAVHAAIQMSDRLHEMGVSVDIGVTTGQVFCGTLGSNSRCEYVVLGDKVNMAARLMVSVSKVLPSDQFPRVLCDASTFSTVAECGLEEDSEPILFQTLPSIQLKGKSQLAAIHQPHYKRHKSSLASMSSFQKLSPRPLRLKVFGRAIELESIAARLKAFLDTAPPLACAPLRSLFLESVLQQLRRPSAGAPGSDLSGSSGSTSARSGSRLVLMNRTLASPAVTECSIECTIVIEGAVGSGKSTLLRAAVKAASRLESDLDPERGSSGSFVGSVDSSFGSHRAPGGGSDALRVVWASSSVSERHTAYFAFRGLLVALLRPHVADTDSLSLLLSASAAAFDDVDSLSISASASTSASVASTSIADSASSRLAPAVSTSAVSSSAVLLSGVSTPASSIAPSRRVRSVLAALPTATRQWFARHRPLLSLLAPVAGLNVHATAAAAGAGALLAAMDHDKRAAITRELVISLWHHLATASERTSASILFSHLPLSRDNTFLGSELVPMPYNRRYLLVMEDFHSLDLSSEALLCDIIRNLSPFVAIMLSVSPFSQLQSNMLEMSRSLLNARNTLHIKLGGLERDFVRLVIQEKLHVDSVDEAITDLVQMKSGGVPLFASELAASLARGGIIEVVREKSIRLLQFTHDYKSGLLMPSLPTSVNEILGSRIDSLPPTQQLLLKVCACAGFSFPISAILHAFPVKDENILASLAENLEDLCAVGFLCLPEEFRIDQNVVEGSADQNHPLATVVFDLLMRDASADSLALEVISEECELSPAQLRFKQHRSRVLQSMNSRSGYGWFVFQLDSLVVDLDDEEEHAAELERACASMRISFENVLVRQVAYERLPYSYRCTLHRVLAEWYESMYFDKLDTQLINLANHWQAVSEFEANIDRKHIAAHRAVNYFQLNGQLAYQHHSYIESFSQFETALSLFQSLPIPSLEAACSQSPSQLIALFQPPQQVLLPDLLFGLMLSSDAEVLIRNLKLPEPLVAHLTRELLMCSFAVAASTVSQVPRLAARVGILSSLLWAHGHVSLQVYYTGLLVSLFVALSYPQFAEQLIQLVLQRVVELAENHLLTVASEHRVFFRCLQLKLSSSTRLRQGDYLGCRAIAHELVNLLPQLKTATPPSLIVDPFSHLFQFIENTPVVVLVNGANASICLGKIDDAQNLIALAQELSFEVLQPVNIRQQNFVNMWSGVVYANLRAWELYEPFRVPDDSIASHYYRGLAFADIPRAVYTAEKNPDERNTIAAAMLHKYASNASTVAVFAPLLCRCFAFADSVDITAVYAYLSFWATNSRLGDQMAASECFRYMAVFQIREAALLRKSRHITPASFRFPVSFLDQLPAQNDLYQFDTYAVTHAASASDSLLRDRWHALQLCALLNIAAASRISVQQQASLLRLRVLVSLLQLFPDEVITACLHESESTVLRLFARSGCELSFFSPLARRSELKMLVVEMENANQSTSLDVIEARCLL